VQHRSASLSWRNRKRSGDAITHIQRSTAKPTILSILITPAIQMTKTYDLQNNKSHSHFLPKFHLFTSDGLPFSYRLRRPVSKTATHYLRLVTDIRQYSKPTIPRKLLKVLLSQQNQYQLLNIKNGLSKAFSNAPKSKMKQYIILSSNYHMF